MSSLNQVNLIGRVGKEPDIYDKVTVFSMATSKKWTDKQGNLQQETEWHRCTCYGKLAEIAANYVKKGGQVAVTGSIKTSEYQKQDGQTARSMEIVVHNLILLGGGQSEQPATSRAVPRQAPVSELQDDDCPF